MNPRLALSALSALAALSLACSITDDSGNGAAVQTPVRTGATFLVGDNKFSPVADTIRVGQHATWAWVGKNAHGLMFSNQTGNQVIVPAAVTAGFDTVFTQPVTINFACTVMIGMTGKLVVTP